MLQKRYHRTTTHFIHRLVFYIHTFLFLRYSRMSIPFPFSKYVKKCLRRVTDIRLDFSGTFPSKNKSLFCEYNEKIVQAKHDIFSRYINIIQYTHTYSHIEQVINEPSESKIVQKVYLINLIFGLAFIHFWKNCFILSKKKQNY